MFARFRLADTMAEPRDYIMQYASDDAGSSWRLVYDGSGAGTPAAIGDVEAVDGGYVVAHFTGGEAVVSHLASASSPIVSQPRVLGIGEGDDSDDKRVLAYKISAAASESGRVWFHWISTVTALGRAAYSDDAGRTVVLSEFNFTFSRDGSWIDVGGYTVPAHDVTASDGGFDAVIDSGGNPVTRLRLGGWTSAGQAPALVDGQNLRLGNSLTQGWRVGWFGGLGAPEAGSWTETGAANHARVIALGSMTFTGNTSGREPRFYARNIGSGGVDLSATVRLSGATSANLDGTGAEAGPLFAIVNLNHGATKHRVQIDIGADKIRAFYVQTGGARVALGAAQTHSLSGTMTWVINVTSSAGGDVAVDARGRTFDGSTYDDDWSQFTFSGTPTSNSDFAASAVSVGVNIETGETATLTEFWSTADNGGTDLGSVPGRPVSSRWIALPGDALIRATGGVADEGDAWVIGDALDGSTVEIGDTGWISDGTAAATVEIHLPESLPGPVVGVCLRGLVADELQVDFYDGLGALIDSVEQPHWITGASMTASAILSGSNGPDQRIVQPWVEGATPFSGMVRPAEFDGCHAVYDDRVERIRRTRGGRWGSGSTYATAALTVDSNDAGGAATDNAGAILTRDVLILARPDQADVRKIVLTFSGEESGTWPADTAWRVDRVVAGQVVALADPNDWGWTQRVVAPVDSGETSDGRINPIRVGPPRREVEISWPNGVWTGPATEDGADPPFVAVTPEGVAWANVGQTPDVLMGIHEQLHGPAGEVVFLPDQPADMFGGAFAVAFPRRLRWIHGRLAGDALQTDNVVGDGDHDNEVVRTSTLLIREIV